jgi:hypothetical protein
MPVMDWILASLELECPGVSHLAPLSTMKRLHTLSLQACSHISGLDLLTALVGLRSLHLNSRPQLSSLAPLAALARLQKLTLAECPYQLGDTAPLSLLPLLSVQT